MNPTVSTHALAKHFGSTPAVDGVDMAVTGGMPSAWPVQCGEDSHAFDPGRGGKVHCAGLVAHVRRLVGREDHWLGGSDPAGASEPSAVSSAPSSDSMSVPSGATIHQTPPTPWPFVSPGAVSSA